MAAQTTSATPSISLQDTPTWALATVCFVFIAISILIEHLLHSATTWLKKRRKTALVDAVERLKLVLMLLGVMSLILTATQTLITRVCVPNYIARSMLPCRIHQTGWISHSHVVETEGFEEISVNGTRKSGSHTSFDYCGSKGKTSLISGKGINELNIFLFVLAVMQVVYSVLTMGLGRAKMNRWKAWERETRTPDYLVENDSKRFRFTNETAFALRHLSCWSSSSIQLWVKCFFRQFFSSVAKIDYLTLRHGFIMAHFPQNKDFNFQKYIQRSLEDDFKIVVSISPFMWFIVVAFILLDVHGWQVYLWASFIPLFVVIFLGAKLEVIVARMALDLKNKSTVIVGSPLVQPNDKLFWFGRPSFVLTFLHFTLFVNAFEVAFFIWVTLEFGIKSCYHEHTEVIITRVVMAVTVQVISSYITLPLYALVTQMGSQFKSVILDQETAWMMKKWHKEVKEKRKDKQIEDSDSNNTIHTLGRSSSATLRISPPLHIPNQGV